ncbi:hypothetical protein K2Z83_02575 [Oscillochloris sp. ZM17-4]|uniref:hypothetical protein n=1 Tax=Oscillochloris sp. ZM17-4 TaxID=2866714 RepID=UPI001C72A7B8|nr:hypothetical protein [Oscillochloris sp. ZM17-4]MBX0326578.1 hypothetical protein [Oscillochloris sp. ZM17-4]
MTRLPVPHVLGLPTGAHAIIAERWRIIMRHARLVLAKHDMWDSKLSHPSQSQEVARWLRILEAQVTHANSESYEDQENGWNTLMRETLLPLAHDLRVWKYIHEQVWTKEFTSCYKHNLFAKPRSSHKPHRLTSPAYEQCLRQVQGIFQQETTAKSQIKALLDQQICQDKSLAASVVKQLGHVDRDAAIEAWAIMLAGLEQHPVHLLLRSNCPFASDIIFVERYAATVALMTDKAEEAMGQIRRIVIALREVLTSRPVIESVLSEHKLPTSSPDVPLEQLSRDERRKVREAQRIMAVGLWRQDLLHRPPFDEARRIYREHITPAINSLVMKGLQERLGCESDGQVFEQYMTRGLAAIADHLLSPTGTGQTFTMQHIRIALNVHLEWLADAERIEIERLLIALQEVLESLEIPISLFPLADTYPGNSCRKGFKKRLKEDPRIISEFCRQGRLPNNKESSGRLYGLATYGALGLRRMTQERLRTIVPDLITHYIHFLKLGHTEGALSPRDVRERVGELCRLNDLPQFSPQVILALFNRLKKAPFWNSGVGMQTDHLHKRVSIYLPKAPLIHRAWVLVPVKIAVPVLNERTSRIEQQAHLMLVFDHDSVLPISCWPSLHLPHAQELGLAIYQALFHPGVVWWPLRGIPRSIHVPMRSLNLDDDDLGDLRQAAYWLASEIQPNPRELHWQKQRLVNEVCKVLPEEVRRRTGNGYVSLPELQRIALSWLYHARRQNTTPVEGGEQRAEYDERLSNQVSVPAEGDARRAGYAVPGFTSPAAGWLLPREGRAELTELGVVLKGNVYTSSFARLGGLTREIPYRAYPYRTSLPEQGIFVEIDERLVYLSRSNNRLAIDPQPSLDTEEDPNGAADVA